MSGKNHLQIANISFKIIENVDSLIVSYPFTTNLTLVHGYSGRVLIIIIPKAYIPPEHKISGVGYFCVT